MVRGRVFRHIASGFWKFLYWLPLTLYPLVFGTLDAVLLAKYEWTRYEENMSRLKFELEADQWMDSFSVPGAPGIHDMPRAPFQLAPLLNLSWYKKLNLTKPHEDVALDAGADRVAALDGLSQEIDLYSHSPTSHWVWVRHMPFVPSSWDAAFDRLVQHHYVHPPARNASLSYVDCASAGFLCGIWDIQPPAMLLFTVEDPEADDNRLPLAFSSRGYPLRPVTVRAVELGLETFRPGTFPSEFDQLLFLTSDEYSFESIKKYNSDEQQMRRFSEWVMLKRKRWPLLHALYKIDDWTGKDSRSGNFIIQVLLNMRSTTATIGAVIVGLPLVIGIKLWGVIYSSFEWFVGSGIQIDPSLDWEVLAPGNGAGGLFWDGFFMTGIRNVFERLADSIANDKAESASELAKAAVTSFCPR